MRILLSLCLLFTAVVAGAQTPAPLLIRAASNDELPLPAWGPYARDHIGPCCLVNRLLVQQFTFPIVIGQQREETILRTERGKDNRLHTRLQQVTLLRRAMNLSPAQATNDDRPLFTPTTLPTPGNRQARLIEADKECLLWRYHIEFAPAGVVQMVAQVPDANGALIALDPWGAGEADVDCFPAFTDPSSDGLLVRVAITNRSERTQTYFVDLLGGIDQQVETFTRKDLTFETDPQDNSLVLKHPKCGAVFALSTDPLPGVLRRYRVGDDYFASQAVLAHRAPDGAAVPEDAQSLLTDVTDVSGSNSSWGLIRLSGISVAPQLTVTLWFSVGVGSDADSARTSARALLGIAADAMPGNKFREGAWTKAQRAHEEARWAGSDEALARLCAQTLGNTPLTNSRRLGVSSRQPTGGRAADAYDPIQGGMIALAYTGYEPSYAAAELNAYFQSNSDPAALIANPKALPPIDLLALWELYQQTHDSALLSRFYPFAQRDYRELLVAGRTGVDVRFSWPAGPGDSIFAPDETGSYLIRSAKLLQTMAQLLHRPDAEIQSYSHDIQTFGNPKSQTPATDTIFDLLPLIVGADRLPDDRRAALLQALTDPTRFWSPYGVRQVSKASPAYHADSATGGGVRFGMNWLLWKGLLDLGETATAQRLTEGLLHAYRAAQKASGGCPEWLNGDTGAPEGANDFSGDACGLIPMYEAYHRPGTVSTGWSVALLDRSYNSAPDRMQVVFRNLEPAHSAVLLCVMGHPGRVYTLSGSLKGTVTADGNGVLTLSAPKDSTSQEVEIVPVPGSKLKDEG